MTLKQIPQGPGSDLVQTWFRPGSGAVFVCLVCSELLIASCSVSDPVHLQRQPGDGLRWLFP